MGERFAILGWGSLLWQPHPPFDAQHDQWNADGPELKIEFSRVSQTRAGALTLVIDPDHGTLTKVAYCLSKRARLEEAIEDLRAREGAPTARTIGFTYGPSKFQARNPQSLEAVRTWATARNITGVVWTDLPSNFQDKTGQQFSIEAARQYIDGLDDAAKAQAHEYLFSAPGFVRTALRTALRAFPDEIPATAIP